MSRAIDITGRRFGEWKVLRRAPQPKPGQARWVCRCSCGTVKTVISQQLRLGVSKRCRDCGHKVSAAKGRERSVRLPDGRTVAQIALATGLDLDTVYHRHIRGWPAHLLGMEPLARGEKRRAA